MPLKEQLKGETCRDGDVEAKALDACRQTQDFPEDLQVDGTKNAEGAQAIVTSSASGVGGAPLFLFAKPAVPASQMEALIKLHCVLTDEEVDAMVLWLISSYMINTFRIFPKLSLISPEKRCGKTTTMETIHALSNRGLLVSNVSAASLFRITEQYQPTLFIDEADTFLRSGDAELVGLINSSHTKAAANVVRCVGENYDAKSFSTWMPMVLASIGDLPHTLMDRSIVINLRRKKSHEHTAPVPVDLAELQEPVRDQITEWCKDNEAAVREASIVPPKLGNDRAADNWAPLFSVAQIVGGDWPARCEQAYRKLTMVNAPELPTQLLIDIRVYFNCSGTSRVGSADLVAALCKDSTGAWQECNNGRQLTQSQAAKLLRPYGISPNTLRFGESTKRGYEAAQFSDAFERYLPPD